MWQRISLSIRHKTVELCVRQIFDRNRWFFIRQQMKTENRRSALLLFLRLLWGNRNEFPHLLQHTERSKAIFQSNFLLIWFVIRLNIYEDLSWNLFRKEFLRIWIELLKNACVLNIYHSNLIKYTDRLWTTLSVSWEYITGLNFKLPLFFYRSFDRSKWKKNIVRFLVDT